MKKLFLPIATAFVSLTLTVPFVFAKDKGGGGGSGAGAGGGSQPGGNFSHGSVAGSAPHFNSAPRHYSASGWNARPYHPGTYHPPNGTAGRGKLSYPSVRSSTVHPTNRSAPHGVNRTTRTDSGGSQTAATARYRRPANDGKWSHSNWMGRSKLDSQTSARLRNWSGKRDNFAQARLKQKAHRRHHHNRDWWRHHSAAIILFDWGFWAWDAGWWYPAWGYDPYYSYYAYDQPIYGYDGLPPDQVVANVQGALQQLGYYHDAVDGIIGPRTRAAIADYQRDNGLPITSAIDEPLLVSLGFIAP
jgi:Putative peptidoglycan binding domain